MTIKTKYNIGDKIAVDGEDRHILSVHLYVSDKKQTERYYLGNEELVTTHNDKTMDVAEINGNRWDYETIIEFVKRLEAHYPHTQSIINTIDKEAIKMLGEVENETAIQ